MSEPFYLQHAYRTKNEPKVHPLIRGSFAFVPSAGMRLSPEVLVLELMRELFFENHFGTTTKTKDLNPDETDEERRYCHSPSERAVLYALRGRRKQSRSAVAQRFFAPAYPGLAKSAWLGKNRERVINNFFLGGPVAQHLWHRGDVADKKREQGQIAEAMWRALLGHHSYFGGSPQSKEVLAVALGAKAFEFAPELSILRFKEKTENSDVVMRVAGDELADCITADTLAICDLEARLPRMQWVQVLMTFLRFALPMWLLAQMRITRLLRAWLLDAVDRGFVPDGVAIVRAIAERNRGLLHPTLTATRELFEHVESYMKARVELSILLYSLEEVRSKQLEGKFLGVSSGGRDVLGIEELLLLAMNAAADIRATERCNLVAGGLDIARFLTREGELFPAWRDPLKAGQGKNIDEFFRVLYRAELGDEAGGCLVIPEGRGAARGFRVFPGQLLLKTITYLAAQGKWSREQRGGAGKLVLQDVEDRFGQYGVDFSSAADARPLLMRELQSMGLLAGSPDAGSSVAVGQPY